MGPTQPPVQWTPGYFNGGKMGLGLKLTTYRNLVPGLRMSRDVFLLPLYAWMTWTGTKLPLAFIVILDCITTYLQPY